MNALYFFGGALSPSRSYSWTVLLISSGSRRVDAGRAVAGSTFDRKQDSAMSLTRDRILLHADAVHDMLLLAWEPRKVVASESGRCL